jgi:MYXO-CTERM domain-containing protein
MKRVATALGLASLIAALGYSDRASACSCAEPTVNTLQVGAGRIPANAGGIVWWFAPGYLRDPAGPLSDFGLNVQTDLEQLRAMVSLQRQSAAGLQPVAAHIERLGTDTYLVRPDAPWSAGERYQLRVDAGEGYGNPETRSVVADFDVVPALAQPSEAPQLQRSEIQRGKLPFMVRDGSCGTSRESVYLDVDFAAPSGLADWPRELLLYTTYVDDERWSHFTSFCATVEPGASWTSRSGNRLLAACDSSEVESGELSEGLHRVRMQAQLPGTDLVFSTQTLEVDLRCSGTTLAAAGEPVVETSGDALAKNASADGCSLSPAAPSQTGRGAGVFGALGLALVAARRSRRK